MQSSGEERGKRDEAAGIAADMAPADKARLVARFGRTFAAGEALFREGEPAKEAFLLQEGRVRLLKRVRMVERSLMVVRPGDLFGESALLDATPRNSTAVALTDGIALALGRDTFRGLLEGHPTIAMRVIDQLTLRVRDAEDQIEIMMLRDTQSKVVSALLKLARDAESSAAELRITPVELSTRVGLDVETVKRTVQRLREQGYIKITGEKVELPDVAALRKLYALLGTKEELKGDAGAHVRGR
ncbi:MAG: Crp/Fnr family transcriptional regulator [Polyangiaceae bacterium]|jgi:CRP/FNR family transcriptional regulator, cyclic AMP receptor protein